MDNLSYFLLPILFVITIFAISTDHQQFKVFKTLTESKDRQAFYKKWVIASFILHGIVSILCLFFIGKINFLFEFPEYLIDASSYIQSNSDSENKDFLTDVLDGIMMSIVPILIFGSPLFTLLITYTKFQNSQK